MSPYKSMKLRDYKSWIGEYGWYIEKAGKDWKVYNEAGNLVIRNLIITHPGKEVPSVSVQKTQKMLEASHKGEIL